MIHDVFCTQPLTRKLMVSLDQYVYFSIFLNVFCDKIENILPAGLEPATYGS